jgi:plasmid maintenance system killer protein
MITNYLDITTKKFAEEGDLSVISANIKDKAFIALIKIDSATCINDLKIIFMDRLKKIDSGVDDSYSIMLDKKHILYFRFVNTNACDVYIAKY